MSTAGLKGKNTAPHLVTRIIFHHLSVMVTSLAKDTKMPQVHIN